MKSSKHCIYIFAATFSAFACGSPSDDDASGVAEQIDISKTTAQMDCPSTHALVGSQVSLEGLAHGVAGVINVVDDCTLELTNFHYDGKGLQVEVYGFMDEEEMGVSLSTDLLRPDKPYKDATLTLRLPEGIDLDSLDRVSVWCTSAGVSFGDAILSEK